MAIKARFVVLSIVIVTFLLAGVYLLWSYHETSISSANGTRASLECPARFSTVTLKASGFTDVVQRYPGSPPTYEFVLTPSSEGNLTLQYDSSGYGSISDRISGGGITPFQFFTITDVYWINSTGYLVDQALNSTGVNITLATLSISNYTATVTYLIQTTASAPDATYDVGFWQTCPGELLTVGNQPYGGTLPWGGGTNLLLI